MHRAGHCCGRGSLWLVLEHWGLERRSSCWDTRSSSGPSDHIRNRSLQGCGELRLLDAELPLGEQEHWGVVLGTGSFEAGVLVLSAETDAVGGCWIHPAASCGACGSQR